MDGQFNVPGLPCLHPYQQEVALAVLDSVFKDAGLTFSVEISRQGGKNEISAQLETFLLARAFLKAENLIKCSPTFNPQAIVSMSRLKDRLDAAGLAGRWGTEHGHTVRLGNARAIFLSASESARVVGHTAHILLEIDEAQDVSKEKYSREFRPMGATTNVTTVLYGTAWDDSTLLEEAKHANLELERRDGIKRHFEHDWQDIARYNPAYLAYVETERQRLGEDHPLFRSQYRLLTVSGTGGFLSAAQRAQLQGTHPRRQFPDSAGIYVAGVDLAGEAEEPEESLKTSTFLRQDSTVITIAQLDLAGLNNPWTPEPHTADDLDVAAPTVHSRQPETARRAPCIRVVEHYRWTGIRHPSLYPRLVDLLRNVWRCRRIVVDATGVGQPVASFLRETIGNAVVPFTFTAPSKSRLGFNLLAAVNSGRLKMYANDGSTEFATFWREIELARSFYRASQTMNFYVDPARGHDDFLVSLALVVEAAEHYQPRLAKGR